MTCRCRRAGSVRSWRAAASRGSSRRTGVKIEAGYGFGDTSALGSADAGAVAPKIAQVLRATMTMQDRVLGTVMTQPLTFMNHCPKQLSASLASSIGGGVFRYAAGR